MTEQTAYSVEAGRDHALSAGSSYFGTGTGYVGEVPMPKSMSAPTYQLVHVELPDWASDLGVGSPASLLVDACCIQDGEGSQFDRCDWLRAAHLHLSGWLERSVEDRRGPIQSYAFRLPTAWSVAYDHAWANRIFLLLRRMAARARGSSEVALFGPVPAARFHLTHDVDALTKTPQLRLKSAIMQLIAVARLGAGGRFRSALKRARDAAGFVFTSADYWLFDEVCALEAERGFKSRFFFADQMADKSLTAWLIDPSYRAAEPRIQELIRGLHSAGWKIGIHPGFNSWNDLSKLSRTRQEVRASLGADVAHCRQHWLRFSWRDTWAIQEKAGVRYDFTLGFNDRSGFRNGSALAHRPWNSALGKSHGVTCVPTIIMDSQFYDYGFPSDPRAAMVNWIDEVVAVGGEASLLWHVHTIHEEYGWREGYVALLDLLKARCITVVEAISDA
ncbi:MAG: hypothetical protein JJ920_19820 [Roseitalea sp.]|jgi:hypothetical protein|nr:hypothetical protein [Roseitalea sp.]MBO6722760.1 hypothetical protein [Roseitalea sp.]MBO6745166.1 hypothetical protein [Roseitalea sp.]